MKPLKPAIMTAMFTGIFSVCSQAADPVQVKTPFNANEVKWIQSSGNSSISGFIIWKDETGVEDGGAVMRRVSLKANDNVVVSVL